MKQFLLIACLALSACTDSENTKKTLERAGYKPLEVGGYAWLAGSKGDVYVTKFKAVAVNGDTVTGVVTKGWFKGSTIRLDD